MKVKDILEELKDVDPETEVTFSYQEGCCSDRGYLDGAEIDAMKLTNSEDHVEFSFNCLPGYESCREAGAINKFIKEMNCTPRMLETLKRIGLGN